MRCLMQCRYQGVVCDINHGAHLWVMSRDAVLHLQRTLVQDGEAGVALLP